MTTGNRSPLTKDLSPRLIGILLVVLVTIWLIPHGHSAQATSHESTQGASTKDVTEHGSKGSGIFGSLDLSKISPWSSPKATPKHDLLIIYVYKENDNALENARFFIQNGLHGSADFIFILNGESPGLEPYLPTAPNVEIFRRDNTCFDLGAYGHVVREKELLKSTYKKFILMNASVRGPFLPTWSRDCWSTAWLSKLSDTMKLQGMTVNCARKFHLQSMIFGTDKEGLESMLNDGTFDCADTLFPGAVAQEVEMATRIMSHGWEVNAWMTALHGDPSYDERQRCGEYGNDDPTFNNWYFGFNLHPYETMFFKANRGTNPLLLDKFTEWHLRMNYTSYDRC